MKIGILQLNSTVGDFDANRQELLVAYAQAVRQGADFVVAPELFLCGYPPRDLLLRPDFVEANLAALRETAEAVGAVPLCVGFVDKNPARPGRPLCNSAAVLQSGEIIWRQHKSLLPTYDVFDEDRYFEPAKTNALFEFKGRKLGITICEDIWNDADFWSDRLYRRDPVKELIAQGADLMLNISASPWWVGKEQTRLTMLQRVARDEHVPLVQVNLVGGNDELIFDGHSVALDRKGGLLALGKGFLQVFIAVGLTLWVNVARVIRTQVFSIRELQYIEAAKALGYTNARIIIRHILPNVLGPVMVIAASNFASAIVIEAGLSFLGVGVQPPQPSWGLMIKENYNFIITHNPLLAIAPGICIMILVLAFNLLGNGLRDALDVRGKL